MDSFLQKVSTEVDHKPTNIVIVTDGQLPLRQCLLPETCSKGINDPPAVFGIFYDLRKEFRKGFPNAPEINSIQDMINCKFLFLYFFFQSMQSIKMSVGVPYYVIFSYHVFLPSSRSNLYRIFLNPSSSFLSRVSRNTMCVGEGCFFFFLLGKSPDEGGKEGDKGLALRLPHTEGVARCLKAILRGNLDARNSRICFPTLNNIEKSKKMNW